MDLNQNQNNKPKHEEQSGTAFDLNQPCRVSGVNFEGVRKTRRTLLAKIVADIFQAKTTINCLERCIMAKDSLSKLDAFSEVEIRMAKSNKNKLSDGVDVYDITFAVHERGSVAGHFNTAVDHQHTHINLQFSLPNVFGLGDTIGFSTKLNKSIYSGEARYSIPLKPWNTLWAPKYSLYYSQYLYDNQRSGIDEENKSIVNEVEFLSLPQLKHNISFENAWRYISSSSIKTPLEVREQSGHSVKSSLKHILTWDTRLVSTNYPSEGILAKLSNEFTLNLVNGSSKFTRHELNLQFNQMILPKYDVILQLNLLAGTLLRPTKINICDKFFSGGPLTLRGFKDQGVGPSVGGHPLGEASYLSAGIHIYSILPYTKPENPINERIRPHIFFNAGTIGDMNDIFRISSREDIRRESLRFWNSFRYSCGLGLALSLFRVRFEINYCIPIEVKSGDLRSDGMQFGFGLAYT